MMTFEEYIGESKQNYIFGGTDNRNTEIAHKFPEKRKVFTELKPGDIFYTYTENIFCAYYFTELKQYSNLYTLCGDNIKDNSRFESEELSINVFSKRFCFYTTSPFCAIGTTLDDLVKFLNDRPYYVQTNIDIDKIKSELFESKQNYIFGGTDNRNAAAIKTFNELERGDIVYWFGNVDEKMALWSYTFEKIIKDGDAAWIDLSGGAEWDCEASDLNLSTIVDEHYGYCLSTDLDELYDVLEKQLKINARNIKIEEH